MILHYGCAMGMESKAFWHGCVALSFYNTFAAFELRDSTMFCVVFGSELWIGDIKVWLLGEGKYVNKSWLTCG